MNRVTVIRRIKADKNYSGRLKSEDSGGVFFDFFILLFSL